MCVGLVARPSFYLIIRMQLSLSLSLSPWSGHARGLCRSGGSATWRRASRARARCATRTRARRTLHTRRYGQGRGAQRAGRRAGQRTLPPSAASRAGRPTRAARGAAVAAAPRVPAGLSICDGRSARQQGGTGARGRLRRRGAAVSAWCGCDQLQTDEINFHPLSTSVLLPVAPGCSRGGRHGRGGTRRARAAARNEARSTARRRR